MNFVFLIFFVFVMFIDVFVVVIGKGFSLDWLCLLEVLCIGIIFGVIEVIIFLVGWLFG